MWYFRSPEVVFGPDALDRLTHLSGHKAFIVTDQTMLQLGFVGQVQARLSAAGMATEVFSDVEAEPTLDTVRRGAAALTEAQPDWIVGLGGGSPLDAAKAMWILYENPETDLLAVNPFEPLGLRRKARLIAISSTSGTGAEVSWGIVLTDRSERRKIAVGSPDNLPDLAIVDPVLAATMPPWLAADTGMDALAHAVEGYTATWHNDFADGCCLQAVRLIFRYLPRSVMQAPDAEAREKMHNAAALAGLGFINSMCSLAHALAHSLGALYPIPHGRAVGLLLPYTIEYNAVGTGEETRYHELAAFLGQPAATPRQGAESMARAIRQLAADIGQPLAIREALPLSRAEMEQDLELLVDRAESDTQIITGVRSPGRADIRRLFLDAYDGRSIDW